MRRQQKAASALSSSLRRVAVVGDAAAASSPAQPARPRRRLGGAASGVKRAIGRGLFDVVLAGAAGGGYVLGAKAGEERYEEIRAQAGAGRPGPRLTAPLTLGAGASSSGRAPLRRPADQVVVAVAVRAPSAHHDLIAEGQLCASGTGRERAPAHS